MQNFNKHSKHCLVHIEHFWSIYRSNNDVISWNIARATKIPLAACMGVCVCVYLKNASKNDGGKPFNVNDRLLNSKWWSRRWHPKYYQIWGRRTQQPNLMNFTSSFWFRKAFLADIILKNSTVSFIRNRLSHLSLLFFIIICTIILDVSHSWCLGSWRKNNHIYFVKSTNRSYFSFIWIDWQIELSSSMRYAIAWDELDF